MLDSSSTWVAFTPSSPAVACSGSGFGGRFSRSVKSVVLVPMVEKKNAADAMAPMNGFSAPSCMSGCVSEDCVDWCGYAYTSVGVELCERVGQWVPQEVL